MFIAFFKFPLFKILPIPDVIDTGESEFLQLKLNYNLAKTLSKKQNFINLLLRGPDGLVWRKNLGVKILWHCPFKA